MANKINLPSVFNGIVFLVMDVLQFYVFTYI